MPAFLVRLNERFNRFYERMDVRADRFCEWADGLDQRVDEWTKRMDQRFERWGTRVDAFNERFDARFARLCAYVGLSPFASKVIFWTLYLCFVLPPIISLPFVRPIWLEFAWWVGFVIGIILGIFLIIWRLLTFTWSLLTSIPIPSFHLDLSSIDPLEIVFDLIAKNITNGYVWLFLIVCWLIGPEHVQATCYQILRILRLPFRAGLSSVTGVGYAEREATLRRASYGAVMLYVAACEIGLFPSDWQPVTRIGLVILGSLWVLLGFGWRSRGDRTGWLIFKFVIKVVLGLVLFYRVDLPYEWLIEPKRLLAIWCLITGAVKLALVLRGPPKPKNKTPAPPAAPRGHGRAGFAPIQGR